MYYTLMYYRNSEGGGISSGVENQVRLQEEALGPGRMGQVSKGEVKGQYILRGGNGDQEAGDTWETGSSLPQLKYTVTDICVKYN